MTITNNNVVAKAAAVVAGLGLVAMSFASFAPAQAQSTTDLQAQINSLLATIASLQAQLGGTTTTSTTFTRDLTIGSTGADVTALQTWLIGKGFSIPAGATGYFGAQTQAALAAYQAANGITPAAGYFGPITRAKIGATTTTTTTTGTGTGSTTLSGGEADLSNYDLRAGDDLSAGDTNEEIASVKFDVDGGDVNVQRVKVTLQGNNTGADVSDSPWRFFDTLYVYDGSTKVGSVDVGSKSDWDDNDSDTDLNNSGLDSYSVSIPVSTVVKDGDTAELSIRADAQSTIDSDDVAQNFTLAIKDQDIRAVDAAGIQEYTGDDNDGVTVGFNDEANGDLSLRSSDDNPDAGVIVADDEDTSDTYTVFAFDIKNNDDADADLDKITLQADVTDPGSGTSHTDDLSDIVRKATLTIDGDDYDGDINTDNLVFDDLDTTVDGNDTVTATLTVQLYGQTNHFAASGQAVSFSVAHADVKAEGSKTGDNSDVSGSVTGKTQSVGVNGGITVTGDSSNTNETYNSNDPSKSTGTFTLKFDVTAVGDDDVYVPKAIQAVASSTSPNASTGVVVFTDLVGSTTSSTISSSLTSTADTDQDNSAFWVINSGDTETFTAQVTIDPTVQEYLQAGIDRIRFTTDSTGSGLQTLDVDQTNSDFQTDQLLIHN